MSKGNKLLYSYTTMATAVENQVKKWQIDRDDASLKPLLSGAATRTQVVHIFQNEDIVTGKVRQPLRSTSCTGLTSLNEEDITENDDEYLEEDCPEHFDVDDILGATVRKEGRKRPDTMFTRRVRVVSAKQDESDQHPPKVLEPSAQYMKELEDSEEEVVSSSSESSSVSFVMFKNGTRTNAM